MYTHIYKELPSYVAGEKIHVKFDSVRTMNAAILTENEYEQYKKDFTSVTRVTISSSGIVFRNVEGRMILVLDLDGSNVDSISTSITRYSKILTDNEIMTSQLPLGQVLVRNAHDTQTDGSMIQYWREHKHKDCKINLNNETFLCPSCGNYVKTSDVHGAHVVKVGGMFRSFYITPTCASCNTSKTDRIFKVNNVDLVVAP